MIHPPAAPSELLQHAAELLEDPKRWIVGIEARDARGREIAPWLPGAVCWDFYGALLHARGSDVALREALRLLAEVLPEVDLDVRIDGAPASDDLYRYLAISIWHDAPERTHADVLSAIQKAIGLGQSASEGEAAKEVREVSAETHTHAGEDGATC